MKSLLVLGICGCLSLPAYAQPAGQLHTWATPGDVDHAAKDLRTAQAERPATQPIHPAVARIVAPGDGSVSYGSGTLVHTGEHYGLVVTNWHVVNEATGPISVHFPDGFYSLGSVQTVDRDWDLAIIAIRRPNAAPVAIADRPPRPGEMLTIAGYGSGTYRSASGPCTQYVAPGLKFPYEMVEVAVSARQGDSGGPIFNQQGELAGVLFGEGHGRTAGSYCGRVRWFLSSVVPRESAQTQLANSQALENVPPQPRPVATDPPREPALPVAAMAAPVSGEPGHRPASVGTPASLVHQDVPSATADAPSAPGPAVVQIGWHDIAGESWGEQFKTVLAAIGILAVVLQILRWLSREEASG